MSGHDFTLGSRNGTFEYSGLMSQVSVWGKQLSASEVTTLYNLGVPDRPDTVSFESDLVSWYPIGEDEGDTSTTLIDNKGTNNLTLQNMSATPYVSDVP